MKNKNLFLIFIIFLIAFFFVEIKIYDKFLFLDEVRILNDTLKIKENNFSELFYPHRIFSIALFNIFIKIFNNIYSLRIIGIFFSVMSIIIFYNVLKLFFDEKKSLLGTILFSSFPIFLGLGPTILTDNIGLFWSIFSIYFYLKYKKEHLLKYLIYSSIILSIGLFFKEITLFTLFAITLDLIKQKNVSSLIKYILIFSILPLIFIIIYWFFTKKILWFDFYLFNLNTFKWRRLINFQYLKLILFYGNLIFFWGFYSLTRQNKKDKYFQFFFIYFIVHIMLFFFWPEVTNRHFVFFLPSLIYFIISDQKIFFGNQKILIILVSFFNYIFSIFFLWFFMQTYTPLIQSINWIESNIEKNNIVYTSNYLIEFLLKLEKYLVSSNINESKYIILESNINFNNLILLKEFKEKCYFSFFRTLDCNNFVIRIFYNKL